MEKPPVVQLLIQRKDPDLIAKDGGGWTPLSVAADAGQEAIVRLLLGKHETGINAQDN